MLPLRHDVASHRILCGMIRIVHLSDLHFAGAREVSDKRRRLTQGSRKPMKPCNRWLYICGRRFVPSRTSMKQGSDPMGETILMNLFVSMAMSPP